MQSTLTAILFLLVSPLQLAVTLVIAAFCGVKVRRILSETQRYPHLEIHELSESIAFFERNFGENNEETIKLKQKRLELIEELLSLRVLEEDELSLYPYYNQST